ncbi:hypothetical protein ZWY2020_047109 [Hordeum vulgare]|nr:hypothetical protein ZWY2020_047109 [Hordeum vulgare]
MLMRRRRLLGPVLPRLLVALLLASCAHCSHGSRRDSAAWAIAAIAVERHERAATDGQAGGNAGNGTNKENNLADMIDHLGEGVPDSGRPSGGGRGSESRRLHDPPHELKFRDLWFGILACVGGRLPSHDIHIWIGVDEWLRVPSVPDVFAVGDCCGFLESTGKEVLPALVQVAERQGLYLARLLNSVMKAGGGYANSQVEVDLGPKFVYKHLGSMATVGRYKALVDLRQSKGSKGISIAGFASWFIWRSAYLTCVVSWRNRLYVAIN